MSIAFRTDFDVNLVRSMADDLYVCQTARVSTEGADSFKSGESKGLINFLMENRHGSPFEHEIFTWMISAPIFVWREFMRHRIASYNEESGRYKQLQPIFYLPPRNRPLEQIGKTGAYEFVQGGEDQYDRVVSALAKGSNRQYEEYEFLLKAGIAKEVARMVLPLNIYSTAYVTMNARALMNFLSLRTKSDDASFKSFPQYEINMVADMMEAHFKELMPLTHEAFVKNGRVQP